MVALRKLIMSRRVSFILTAATLLSSPPAPVVFCEGARDDREKKNPSSYFTSSDKPSNDKPFSFTDKEFKFEDFIRSELNQGGLTPVRSVLESGVLGQVGYGFLMGYSSGFCVKKVSKIAAFMVGGAFIFIQTLSYGGLIHVDYEGLQRKVEKTLDLNKDGKLDDKDAEAAFAKVQEVLGYNVPSGGGFTAGFIMGLRG
eukprot:gene28289-34157_t